MTRKMHVTHHYVVDIDPDRLEEYVEANFKLSEEHVVITDLDESDGVTSPIVFQDGPYVEDIVWEARHEDSPKRANNEGAE